MLAQGLFALLSLSAGKVAAEASPVLLHIGYNGTKAASLFFFISVWV